MENNKFYSVVEVSEMLGITRQGVLDRIVKGKLKAMKIGSVYIIKGLDIKKTPPIADRFKNQ